MSFTENLRACLASDNIDQKQCAEELGVSYSAFGSWVRGRTQPDFEKLLKISNYFKVSIDYLLDNQRESRWKQVDSSAYKCECCGIEWELDPGHDPFIDEMYYCPKCGRRMTGISTLKK